MSDPARMNLTLTTFRSTNKQKREVLVFSSHTQWFLWRVPGLNTRPWGDHTVLRAPSPAGTGQKKPTSSQGFAPMALVSLWRQLCPHTFPRGPAAVLGQSYATRPQAFHLLGRALLPEKTPERCLFGSCHVKNDTSAASAQGCSPR